MISDLHSHSYYSFCGRDNPEDIIKTAIDAGIDTLGICDHSYGITGGRRGSESNHARAKDYQLALDRYVDHLSLLKEKYLKKIRLLIGIEISTRNQPHLLMPEGTDLSRFDYCLVESLGSPESLCFDLFSYADSLNCPLIGLAHTDLPQYLDERGIDKLGYFRAMAERGIFWEMNVNYDSTHNYREFEYVKEFFRSRYLQDLVRNSGLRISVGFDGHKIEDYLPERVRDAHKMLRELGIKTIELP